MKKAVVYFLIFIHSLVFSQNQLPKLKLVAEYIIEHDTEFKKTTIGGLSGIEYYSDSIFYLISDDYGKQGLPRVYKTAIQYNADKIIKVNFLDIILLQPPPGKFFASLVSEIDTNNFLYSDAEAIRYDRDNNYFLWASEGFNDQGFTCQPFIFRMKTNGVFISQIPINPAYVLVSSKLKGLQHNACMEGLAFVPNTNTFIYTSEKSLTEDMDAADTIKPIRIIFANKYTGSTESQFAYIPDNTFNNNSNGVVDLLALSSDTLLVLERAYDQKKGNVVKLFQAIAGKTTTDIKNITSLRNQPYIPLQKKLLFDFSKSGIHKVDNIEGMSWGYQLGENKKSILFISDNNFNKSQITQLLLFEYINRE